MKLPEGKWIYCTVELRFSRSAPSQNTQFIELSAAQQRLIDRCINKLEREAIRKNAVYQANKNSA